ncbi:MAG TPA: DUF4388 domain-containing protein [Ktedonobacteraceae bacterium]|nr:DUF4388 domain-containing protein [Ktedonobacteraceae bacterium]
MPQAIAAEYLTQLLKTISQEKQTGCLRIEPVGAKVNEQGQIYFENGRMMDASVGDERGRPALKHIVEWEHVIYAFNRTNRSSSYNGPGPAEQKEAGEPQTRIQPRSNSQTTHLNVPFQASSLEKLPREKERSTLTTGKMPPVPDLQTREPDPLTAFKATIASPQSAQSLILRGAILQKDTPASLPHPPHARMRWTRRLDPQTDQQGTLPQPPFISSQNSLPEDGLFSGRLAIFKAKTMATTAQAIQRMDRHDRMIFVLLNGERTIERIAHLIHYTEDEIARILYKLQQNGLIEYIRG